MNESGLKYPRLGPIIEFDDSFMGLLEDIAQVEIIEAVKVADKSVLHTDLTTDFNLREKFVIYEKIVLGCKLNMDNDLKRFIQRFVNILNKLNVEQENSYLENQLKVESIKLLQNRIFLTCSIYIIMCDLIENHKDDPLIINKKMYSKLGVFEGILNYILNNIDYFKYWDHFYLNNLSSKLALETWRAMSTFLFIVGSNCSKQQESIIKAIISILNKAIDSTSKLFKRSNSLKILRLSLSCISTLYTKISSKFLDPAIKENLLEKMLLLLKSIVCKDLNFELELSYTGIERNKIIKAILKNLILLLKEDRKLSKQYLNISFFPVLKKLWDFELNNKNHSQSDRLSAIENNSIGYQTKNITSESDLDYKKEGDVNDSKVQLGAEIRELTQKMINLFIERNKTNLMDVWSLLLPIETYWKDPSLLYIISNDPSIPVRQSTLDNLFALLSNARKMLPSGIYRELNKMSFISLSDKIGHVINQIFLALFNVVRTEISYEIINKVYKCLEILIVNCSHPKLGDKIQLETFSFFNENLNMLPANSIRQSFYTNLNVLLNSEYHLEYKQKLIDEHGEKIIEDAKNIGLDEDIRYSTLICLSTLTELEMIPWAITTQLIDALITENKTKINNGCIKMLISCLKWFKNRENLDNTVEFQILALDEYVSAIASTASLEVKSTIAELFTHFEKEELEQLKTGRKMFCISLLLGMFTAPFSNYSANTFRALGKWITFEELKIDCTFLNDTTSLALQASSSELLEVRATAAWCLANAVDGFVELKKGGTYYETSLPLDDITFFQIMDKALIASKEHDKLKWNGSRILGNLILIANEELLNYENGLWLQQALQSLNTNLSSGALKVRWNSAFAIHLAIQNSAFPTEKCLLEYYQLIESVLEQLLKNSNFKVLTNCCYILQNIRLIDDRTDFGNKMARIEERLNDLEAGCKFSELNMFNGFKDQFYKGIESLKLKSILK